MVLLFQKHPSHSQSSSVQEQWTLGSFLLTGFVWGNVLTCLRALELQSVPTVEFRSPFTRACALTF